MKAEGGCSMYSIRKVLQKMEVELVAGITGALVSTSIMTPLDIARTRWSVQAMSQQEKYKTIMQTFSTIIKEEGYKGLYTGYAISLLTTPAYHALFFTTYSLLKDYPSYSLLKDYPSYSPLYTEVVSSAAASILADVVTCPLWVARLRVQTQVLHNNHKYTSLLQTLQLIYKEEGISKGLYKGLFWGFIGVVHFIIYFPLYEELKRQYQHHYNTPYNTSFQIVTSSILAKVAAILLTYPHVVVRNRLQFDYHIHNNNNISCYNYNNNNSNGSLLKKVIRTTYIKQGLPGFYSGLTFELIRVLPTNTIIFFIYENTKIGLQNYLYI